MLNDIFTRDKWFRLYQGVAQDVEYVDENATTTETNFYLNGCSVNVPGQAKNRVFIKEHDVVDLCGRPSLTDKDKTICLAYRIHKVPAIYSINEMRHVSIVILCFIVGPIYLISFGWRWPLFFVAICTVYYAISSYLSFSARARLAAIGCDSAE